MSEPVFTSTHRAACRTEDDEDDADRDEHETDRPEDGDVQEESEDQENCAKTLYVNLS